MFEIESTTTIEVNLNTISFKNWPEEAKTIAFGLMTKSRIAKAFLATPKADRKAWLVVQVENEQARQRFNLFVFE